jgi:alpha-tubulin suppressor-like RCC1 family protein
MRLRFVLLAAAALASSAAIDGCTSEGVIGKFDGDAGADAAAEAGPGEVPISTSPIAASGASTCVRTSAGEARCWGDNSTGGLGIGESDLATSRDPQTPIEKRANMPDEPLHDVKALFAGEAARCALTNDGKLHCWGQLGVIFVGGGPYVNWLATYLHPSPSTGPFGDVAHVAIGRLFTCVLTKSGEVRCFGKNDKGQVGLGRTDDETIPTTVNGFDAPATSVCASMGGDFACASTASGAVYCWGDGSKGQFGGAREIVRSPRQVDGMPERAVQVACAAAHVCARLESGRVACWGKGTNAELGDRKLADSAVPVLADVTDIVTIAAGRSHTCGVRTEGSVFCWGADDQGQSNIYERSYPWVALEATFRARAVTCGFAHTCAWGEGGRVQCWGADALAQLGPKTATF